MSETLSEQIHRPKDFEETKIRSEDVVIHMSHAYEWAKRRCYAKRRKVGAVIVKENRAISSGFNGTLPNHPNVCEKDGITLEGVIHAEKNAVFKLMENDNDSPKNSAMFVTTAPCFNCAGDLLLAKISSVYFSEMYRSCSGVEKLIRNGVSVYHVNMKAVEEHDKKVVEDGTFDYQNLPENFIETIYESTELNDLDKKEKAIKRLNDIFSGYVDGAYHSKFYDVSN